MLKMLQSYRALVELLVEAHNLKNKYYENAVSKCIEDLKPEIDKFLEWADDCVLKKFIELFYCEAYNPAQYERESGGTSYDSARACCRRRCKQYDTISGK